MNYSKNEQVNLMFYNKTYENVNFGKHQILYENFDTEFLRLKQTHASWNKIFNKNLITDFNDKFILEVGAGDCYHALAFSLLGAKVFINDISPKTREIVKFINIKFKLRNPMIVVEEDLKQIQINQKFDIIIGIAFIHHLDEELEERIIQTLRPLLKEKGKMYFFEPISNSVILKLMKDLFPSRDRPSILFYKRFKSYRQNLDPHPVRDNSSKHYIKMAKKTQLNPEIYCYGLLYNLVSLFPSRKKFLLESDNQIEKLIFFKWVINKFGRNAIIEYRLK